MKIHALNYRTLRNEEFLGLHKYFVEQTASITSEEIRKSIEAYRTSVTEYANLIEVSVDESAARAVSRLDSERNAAYSSCRNFAKSLKSLADSGVVATGERLRKIFAENADPTRLNQDQSTGTFTNLINTLKEIGDDKLSACGFKPWLENLESKHNEYLTAVQNRNKEIASKVADANLDMREFERVALLGAVDRRWMDHIDAMDELRDGIGLRAYGQKNPIIEYKREGYDMFEEMVHLIQEDTLRRLYFTVLAKPVERKQVAQPTAASHGEEGKKVPVKKTDKKVGPNDPCPCGSGKKYKKCCGAQ